MRQQQPGHATGRKREPVASGGLLNNRQGIAMSLVSLLVLAGAGAFFMIIGKQAEVVPLSAPVARPPVIATDIPTAPSAFRCDGRTTCAQMTSCAEAKYFLRHCPGTKMDGNRDGEPCEQQWCN